MEKSASQSSFLSKFALMKRVDDRILLFYPRIVYDIAQFIFFPVNYLLSCLCYIQLEKSVWSEKGFESIDISGTGKGLDQIKAEVMSPESLVYNQHDIVRLYDSLPAVDAHKDLIGRTWRGKVLRTNKSALDFAEWAIARPFKFLGCRWGKRYRTAHKGDPLMMCWKEKLYFPIPVWGNVGMTNIEWRGQSTATMNYDHQPWKDYFKLLSDEDGKIVLLGSWTHKHLTGGWFTLTLDTNIPRE